jgi:hypothetical protein
LPKAEAAPDPVIGRIIASGRKIHTRIAKFDLNFVIDWYLPEKLKQPGKLLP